MSDAKRNDRFGAERMDGLMLEHALWGLSESDERELGSALESDAAQEYELGAAAVALALGASRIEPMPDALRAKLQAGAKAYFADREVLSGAPPRRASAPTPSPSVGQAPRATPRSTALSNAGWWFAAAAAVLALIAWWPERSSGGSGAAELRVELLARADAKTIEAKGQEPFAPGAAGDIVWSNSAQQGFIRLVGAPRNDPKVQQYQLWIFDEAQEHPVDGGVFDITASGEVLIPIDAKLRVTKPTLFAITLEKPGGVVVSDRQRIAIVAPL